MKADSIDPREVAYYEDLADQWWDRQGKFWPLHRLNELRVEYLKQAICQHFGRSSDSPEPLAGLSIVDIGCGGGILSESMAALGASVHGIDVVDKSIRVARQHSQCGNLKLEYELTTVADLATRSRCYDIVLNMEVVEHVVNLPDFMSDCAQLLQDNGIMFVATINRNPMSWLTAIIGAEYILGWLPRGTHTWSRFVRPGELGSMLGKSNLKVIATAGVSINPFTRKFSLGRQLMVNYMLAATRAVGNC